MFINKEATLKQYHGLIINLMRKSGGWTKEEFNDMYSAGKLGLFKGLKSWRKKKGSNLTTWLYLNIRKSLQNYKNSKYLTSYNRPRKTYEDKENPLMLYEIVSEVQEDSAVDYNTPLDIIIKEERTNLVPIILLKLQKVYCIKDCELFRDYFLLNYRYQELERKYGQSYGILHNRLQRILTTAKEHVQAVV